MKTKQEMLRGGGHGGCFQDLEIREIKSAQGIRRGPAGTFLRFLTTSFELRAANRSVFCHLLPRPAPPAPQSLSLISAVTAVQAAAQLEVA